jgi:hypothetical protein
MKKGIQAYNQAIALWQKVRIDGRVFDLVKEPRRILGIPEDGFKLTDEYDLWRSKMNEKKIVSVVYEFIDECKKIIPYEQILTDHHFAEMLIDFFYYNNVDDELFKKWESSGFKVKIIKDSRVLFSNEKELESGVYLKINPFSPTSHIIKYVKKEKKLIESAQDFFLGSSQIKKRKKVNFNPNYSRDRMIVKLDSYTKKEIKELFGVDKEYKESSISFIMKELGLKNISSDIVKAVKQRRKLKK